MSEGLEDRVVRLEARVRELEDREELRALRCEYHEYINQSRFDEIPGLFTEDGEMDFGYLGKGKGREELARVFANAPNLLQFVKQFIHNHVVSVEGDRATGVSYLEAKSVSQGKAFVVAGRYDDVCERVDGQWRFARMQFDPYFTVPFDEGWAQEDLLKMGRLRQD